MSDRNKIIQEAKVLANFKPADEYEKDGLEEATDTFFSLHGKAIIDILSKLGSE